MNRDLGWGPISFLGGLIVGMAFIAMLFMVTDPYVPDCVEDDAWIAVDHHATDAVQDERGVHRACRNVDQMLNSAVEVWIQNQP